MGHLIYAGLVKSVVFYLDRQRKSTLRQIKWLETGSVLRRRSTSLELETATRNHPQNETSNLNSFLKPGAHFIYFYHPQQNELDQWNQDSSAEIGEKVSDHKWSQEGDQKCLQTLMEQNSNIDEDWGNFVKKFWLGVCQLFKDWPTSLETWVPMTTRCVPICVWISPKEIVLIDEHFIMQ